MVSRFEEILFLKSPERIQKDEIRRKFSLCVKAYPGG
jgi:hypothetical protein